MSFTNIPISHESVWRAIPMNDKKIGDKLSSTTIFSQQTPMPLSPLPSSRRTATAASYVAAARARSRSTSSARNERNDRAAKEALQWPRSSDEDRELYKAVFSTMKRRTPSADKTSYLNEQHTQSTTAIHASFPDSNTQKTSRLRIPFGAETARARAIEEAISNSAPLPYQRQKVFVDAAVAELGSPPSKSGARVLRPPTTIIRPPSAEQENITSSLSSSSSATASRGYVLPEFPPSISVKTVSEISTQTNPDDATAILKISGTPKSLSTCLPSDALLSRPAFDLHFSSASGSSKRKITCMHVDGKKHSDEKTLAGIHRTGGGYTGVVRARVISSNRNSGVDIPQSRGRTTVTYTMPPLIHPRYLPSPLTPPLAPLITQTNTNPNPSKTIDVLNSKVLVSEETSHPQTSKNETHITKTIPTIDSMSANIVTVKEVVEEEKEKKEEEDKISLPQLVVFMRAFGEELATKMGEAAAAAVEMSAAEQAFIGKTAADAMASDELLLSLLMQEREEVNVDTAYLNDTITSLSNTVTKMNEKEKEKEDEIKFHHKHKYQVSVRPLPIVMQTSTTAINSKPPLSGINNNASKAIKRRPIVAPLGPSPLQQKESYQATLNAFERDMKKANQIARDISRRASEVSEEAVFIALSTSMQGIGVSMKNNNNNKNCGVSSILDEVMVR
jgi:hypothetical protein